MVSVNIQPTQIKANAKSESDLPSLGRGSGKLGGKAKFLQFLRPKKDLKSRLTATDAQSVSGSQGTAKGVLNGTKPSRSSVVHSKNRPGQAEAKPAGMASKHAAVTKRKSNVPDDRGGPVAALGQAQQQVAAQLAAKVSLAGRPKNLNILESTTADGQLEPPEVSLKKQAGKLTKSIKGTANGHVKPVKTSTVPAAKISSKIEPRSFTKPIKTAVDSSNNSLPAKEGLSGGGSRKFNAGGAKYLAEADTPGNIKPAESIDLSRPKGRGIRPKEIKTVLDHVRRSAATTVNVIDARGVGSTKTVQHRIKQERLSGENAPRVPASQGAPKQLLSDAPKVATAVKPVTVQVRLKSFSLKEGRAVAQRGMRMPLNKVALNASKPNLTLVQPPSLTATKKSPPSRQELQVQNNTSEPVAVKSQNSGNVNPPSTLKSKHVAVSKLQASHPSNTHQPFANIKIDPLGQARSNGLTSETGLRVSKGASVNVAVSPETKGEKSGSLLKPAAPQKTKVNYKAHSNRVSTSSAGELNGKSEGVGAAKYKTLTTAGVAVEGDNASEKNGIELNRSTPKPIARHLGFQANSVSDADSEKEPIRQLPRYQGNGTNQDSVSTVVASSPKSKTGEVSKLVSVLQSITQAANTVSPAKFNNRGLSHQSSLIQRIQKAQTPSSSHPMADGIKLKNPNNKKPQATINQSLATQTLGAVIKSKNPQLSVGTQTRPTQRRLEQSIASSKKTQRTGNVEIKSASGGIEAAFLKSEMNLTGKTELSNDVLRQNLPLGESFVSDGAKSHASIAAEMLEAGRSDLSHIKDVAVRNDLANRLNQMEVDLQTVQTKSNQPKGQAAARAIVYREIMSAVEAFRGMNNARWAMTIEPFDSLRIQLDLRMTDSQLVVQARLDRGSQALLSSGWSELQASLAEKDVDLKSLITNGQKENGDTLFNGKNGRQSDESQRGTESWFSDELGELMAEFEKEAQQPRKAKRTNRKPRMADATFESWA